MGLFENLMGKVGNAMEKSMSKNLQGESKEAYEKEKAEKAENKAAFEKDQQAIKDDLASRKIQASSNDLKSPEALLAKIGVIDESKIWVGGFDNFKANQNAKFANIFSGNKNIKIVSLVNGVFYLSKFEDGNFYAYKKFTKEQVASAEIEGLLSKKIRIKLNDNTTYSVDITENKEKLD
ncbi:MAG: hypothetical protein PHC84_02570, partial [Clostridia bacterium]|nr:hypothetical protein [Clostridia bacterium]